MSSDEKGFWVVIAILLVGAFGLILYAGLVMAGAPTPNPDCLTIDSIRYCPVP